MFLQTGRLWVHSYIDHSLDRFNVDLRSSWSVVTDLVQHLELNHDRRHVVPRGADQVSAPHVVTLLGGGPFVLGDQGEASRQELSARGWGRKEHSYSALPVTRIYVRETISTMGGSLMEPPSRLHPHHHSSGWPS